MRRVLLAVVLIVCPGCQKVGDNIGTLRAEYESRQLFLAEHPCDEISGTARPACVWSFEVTGCGEKEVYFATDDGFTKQSPDPDHTYCEVIVDTAVLSGLVVAPRRGPWRYVVGIAGVSCTDAHEVLPTIRELFDGFNAVLVGHGEMLGEAWVFREDGLDVAQTLVDRGLCTVDSTRTRPDYPKDAAR